jgi:hypothetical protein
MPKRIKSILFVICVVMVFTAQTNRPDEKGQQRAPQHAPVSRPKVQTHKETPQQAVHRAAPPTAQTRISSQSSYQQREAPQRREAPRVHAVPTPTPVENNRLFHRQHHNNRQPLYNFYNDQYQFYPYVNVASLVELSEDYAAVLFNGQMYYYDQGSFYVQDPQGYLATPPPIGIIVRALPPHARQIDVNGQIYYRYKGVFYIQVAQGYQVVGPVQVPPDGS